MPAKITHLCEFIATEGAMSEYQYYEFQAIDRPLTTEQQAAMRKLSSRVELSATRAAFNYSYGDFRGEPLKVLEQHFDALLYIANWGSKQLAFRFPRASIAAAQLEPYLLGDEESYVGDLHTTPQYLILNLETREEEGYGWIAGEGLLDPLIPLREAILRGDLRALYLFWLRCAAEQAGWADEDEEPDPLVEPPVPPGLGQLDPALGAFADFVAKVNVAPYPPRSGVTLAMAAGGGAARSSVKLMRSVRSLSCPRATMVHWPPSASSGAVHHQITSPSPSARVPVGPCWIVPSGRSSQVSSRSIGRKPCAEKVKLAPGTPLRGSTLAGGIGATPVTSKGTRSSRCVARPRNVITQVPPTARAGTSQRSSARPSPSTMIGLRRVVSAMPSGWVGQ
jgi:hypothetical protein